MDTLFASNAFPRLPLLGAGLMLATTVAVIGLMRQVAPLSAEVMPPALVERHLSFEDRADGAVNVIDRDDPSRTVVIAPGTDGFLRATLRTFARERKRQGHGALEPFVLSAYPDGRLSLLDPSTGRRIDLVAFGPSNSERFARLLRPVN